MEKHYNILSTFDGMSCIQILLHKKGITNYTIYAAEIDPSAMSVAKANYPDTIHIGDVTKVKLQKGLLITEEGDYAVGKVDFFCGGSPCQSLSGLGDGSGFDGKSGLFYHWLRLRNEVLLGNPEAYWLLENVVPKKSLWKELLDKETGVMGVLVDSKNYVPIRRPRIFWCNWLIEAPTFNPLSLEDVITCKEETEFNKLTQGRLKWVLGQTSNTSFSKGYSYLLNQRDPRKELQCLTARSEGSWNSNYVLRLDGNITKLSTSEYEYLQGVPEGYTNSCRITQAYKMLGNGWCIYPLLHVMKNLPM